MIKKEKTSPWRRIAVLALIPSFGLFFWASATPRYVFTSDLESISNKSQEETNDSVSVIGFAANEDNTKALYVIDEKESSYADMKKIDPKDIESVSVFKNKSAEYLYGSKGRNGVIIITTKNKNKSSSSTEAGPKAINTAFSNTSNEKEDNQFKQTSPLVILDGKEISNEILQTIEPDKIDRVEVLKGDKATASYGTRGKDGVILVTLKK